MIGVFKPFPIARIIWLRGAEGGIRYSRSYDLKYFCEILTNFLLILSLLVSGTLEHQSADVKDKRYEKLTPLSVGIHNNRRREGDRGKKDLFQTETNITLI